MSIGQSIASGLASGAALGITSQITSRLPPTKRAAGVGAPAGFDPVADAVKSLGAIQAYMAAVVTPAGATPEQLQAAQQAVQSLASDLIQIQAQQQQQPSQPPPGVWVRGSAATVATAGALAIGGVAGWFLRGRKDGSAKEER